VLRKRMRALQLAWMTAGKLGIKQRAPKFPPPN